MPETPEELFARARDALRMPPVETWETFPFEGDLRPRTLTPPVAEESPRRGAGGVDCWGCAAPDTDFAWVSGRWRLKPLDEPSGLPVILLLEPREHYGEPGELPDELAAELGVLIARIDRAIKGRLQPGAGTTAWSASLSTSRIASNSPRGRGSSASSARYAACSAAPAFSATSIPRGVGRRR
jgi:hypothetical protein